MHNKQVRGRVTQEDRVLQHLQDFGTISSLEAFKDYGITRLSAKIFNLRALGYNITTHFVSSKNRYGDTTRYGVYTLVEGE